MRRIILASTLGFALAGTSVAAWAEPGDPCGGRLGACSGGLVCAVPEGAPDDLGVCQPRSEDAQEELDRAPVACTRIYQPVCGTNGLTYGNRCEADAAAATVAHEGVCGG